MKYASKDARDLLLKSMCAILSEMGTHGRVEVENGIVYVHCPDMRDGLGSGYWDFTIPIFHREDERKKTG